ncbi:MAG: hypothetical protein ACREDR_15945 [Blastocatellia bacterium]
MAVVHIEGKTVTLPDEVVNAGDAAIRRVLEANGFPAVENAEITVEGPKAPGAPAIVSVRPRAVPKGFPSRGDYSHFIQKLAEAPEYKNPAISLANEVQRADLEGDPDFFERAARSGQVERAIVEGDREGNAVSKGLFILGHALPQAALKVPVGF